MALRQAFVGLVSDLLSLLFLTGVPQLRSAPDSVIEPFKLQQHKLPYFTAYGRFSFLALALAGPYGAA